MWWIAEAHMPFPSSVARERCHCADFAVCTAEGLASVLLRLPSTVASRASPWYSYLQTVYHDSLPPLPITGLRERINLLYPALLPTQVCLQTPRAALALPLCATDACAQWLPGPPAGAQQVADFLVGRTFIWTAAVGGESRRPFGHVVALQPPLAMRRPASAQLGWVEVLRRKASVPEGWGNSGCWFHQVLACMHFTVSPPFLSCQPTHLPIPPRRRGPACGCTPARAPWCTGTGQRQPPWTGRSARCGQTTGSWLVAD